MASFAERQLHIFIQKRNPYSQETRSQESLHEDCSEIMGAILRLFQYGALITDMVVATKVLDSSFLALTGYIVV